MGGYRIVNIENLYCIWMVYVKHDDRGVLWPCVLVVLCSGAGMCAFEESGKNYSDISRYVILNHRDNRQGSLQVKTDLCQGSHKART